jgi:hypothetical protein
MKTTKWNLSIALLALTPMALAQKSDGADGKPAAPVSAEQVIRLYKLGDLDDLDLKGADDKSLGDLDGLVIDSANGRVLYALIGKGGVLGIGEAEHLLPWESIRFTAKEKGDGCVAHTSLTSEKIESAPLLPKDKKIDIEIERRARENAGLRRDTDFMRAIESQLLCSTDVKGARVNATDGKEFGKLSELVIAPEEGMVAYAVLATGGVLGLGEKHFALPWSVLETTYDKDKKLVFRAPLTKELLEKAPEYDAKDWNRMQSPGWLRDVFKHYSKEPFWSPSIRAGAQKN